jgi:cytoskeletal protein CcmA (bactofilin family)
MKDRNGQIPSITMISEEAHLKGSLEASSDVRIAGTLTGDVSSQGKVIVASSAKVDGNMSAKEADISGQYKGDIHATEKITIRKGAELNGDLSTKTVVIEEGAQFNGQLSMGEAVRPGSNGTVASSGVSSSGVATSESSAGEPEVNPSSHETKVH